MKFGIFRLGVIFVFGFGLFFCIRLFYGYVVYPNGPKISSYTYDEPVSSELIQAQSDTSELSSSKSRNIAGQKQKSIADGTHPTAVDQRYEKVADIGLKSEEFQEDSLKLRMMIKKYDALVQYEQSNGLIGRRFIKLAMGVAPERFDMIIEDLKVLGKLKFLQINKTDKTNEYRSLMAKQISLTKSRDALLALKKQEAKVEESIALEEKILEIENRIQELGVNLGDFDSENEFVTVKLSMWEMGKTRVRNISILKRSFKALEWAVKYYALFVLSFFGFLLVVLTGTKILEIASRMQKTSAAKD